MNNSSDIEIDTIKVQAVPPSTPRPAQTEQDTTAKPEPEIVQSARPQEAQQPVRESSPQAGRMIVQDPAKKDARRPAREGTQKLGKTPVLSKRDEAIARLFQERCRQLNISVFYQDDAPARSLGFTSAIHGEGKTLLSVITANQLANDSTVPVTLIECNWEHPSLHEYYNIPPHPGIAEWLRRECKAEDIRHQVAHNLTVIPAGDGRKDALRLLAQMRQLGLEQMFANHNDLLVVDLPPIATTAYGQVAASLLDSVVLVVHAGVTPDIAIAEACSKLKNASLQGIILNQFQSHIPRWLRQIL